MAKLRVLLADDDSFVQKALRFHLILSGYSVLVASDGFEAAKILRRYRIDLVISDLNMPHIDGFELASWMRGTLKKQIPILGLTSERSYQQTLKAMRAGVNDLMQKPFHPNEITSRISRLLG
jgi:DNA-binding response OmpR family regulator